MQTAEVLRAAVASLKSGDATLLPFIAGHVTANVSEDDLRILDDLSDDLKVQVLQQFFQHVSEGTHKTAFNQRIVASLLQRWYSINLGRETGHQRASDVPGRSTQQTFSLDFGETRLFLYMSDQKMSTAHDLIETISHRAVLTTEATSPPCELSEVVPLWLQNRSLAADAYYLGDKMRDNHPLQDYFDRQVGIMRDCLHVSMVERSTEMAIIANGDALRFHRDRLVNQYGKLNTDPASASSWQIVQDLTLIDWDMQPGTVSGTAFEHPNGDRYLFVLRPGEVVGLFFAEAPQLPGPMMMPYHCALPVFDYAAGESVGPAKGKRLSALTRGLAPAREIIDLESRSIGLAVDGVGGIEDGVRRYTSGISVRPSLTLPATQLNPSTFMPGGHEGLSISKLSNVANAKLLRTVTGAPDIGDYEFYRIEKFGEGFSDLLNVLPHLGQARNIHVVNRSVNGPQQGVSFPLALDYASRRMPWIQMLRLNADDVVALPPSTAPLLRLTPTDHLLHRSAPLDSFYPSPVQQARFANIVEIAFH